MRISAIKLQKTVEGLQPFDISLLKDLVLVTGSNGAGKTRLLKMIQRNVECLQGKSGGNNANENFAAILEEGEQSESLTELTAKQIQIINYSHYDARLQVPTDFSPYVIHNAKEILKKCNYEETALNALLFIEDMAKGYSEEFHDGKSFQKFQEEAADDFEIQVSYDKNRKKLQLFGQDIDEAELSPGQQYLLRMAVACFQNENKENLIFFMDEPELHLHPKALIELMVKLRKKFPTSQFWISTHSLALVSYFSVTEKEVSVLCFHNGKLGTLRSDSSSLLDGLIGSEENRFAIEQLMMTPDAYASNKFALECYEKPLTLGGKGGKDPQVSMIETMLLSGDVIVDYGAGQGRFFEELALGNAKTKDGKRAADTVTYYAYNKKEYEKLKDAQKCKEVMDQYGSTSENYFNDFEMLKKKLSGRAKYVLLVNVLHEISPCEWEEVFKNVQSLLSSDGKIIIVEREELMTGEAPYDQGFLMITSRAAEKLFGKEHVEEYHYPGREYLVRYVIDFDGLNVKDIDAVVNIIKQDALDEIKKLKRKQVPEDRKSRFALGIKLAFWLHEYANASLLSEENFSI